MEMKIGIIGAGHLGKIHIKCIQQITEFAITGIYDNDPNVLDKVSGEFKVHAFSSIDDLIAESEVVSIVTPTSSHFEIASKAIKEGKHVFIEKPVTKGAKEAKELVHLAKNYNVKVQIGHVERFNPALMALQDEIIEPAFMEVHRLSNFNPRSTDVSVIHDLMIHDIDIILHFVKSPVREIRANGLKLISDHDDICNARIEFENGAVANLTASRVSVTNMRKMRLFQKDAYISMDFLEKKSQVIRIRDEKEENAMLLDLNDHKKWITIRNVEGPELNAIKTEFEYFFQSIKNDSPVFVPLVDGARAVEVADKVVEAVKNQGDLQHFISNSDKAF